MLVVVVVVGGGGGGGGGGGDSGDSGDSGDGGGDGHQYVAVDVRLVRVVVHNLPDRYNTVSGTTVGKRFLR